MTVADDHRVVGPDDRGYPAGLLDLEAPPTLFVLGETSTAPAVAVVGTRRSTRYGMSLAEAFGGALAGAGWTTLSGLARGIDSAAHRGTLRVGGEAVAVLGSGIDVVYPPDNADLYHKIVDGNGAVTSEYPPGTPPDRWRFPARNRIIAAIASAVVVVEAGEKGGALITARLAAELGRPVFAVPGDVDRPASMGCNRLGPPPPRPRPETGLPDTGILIDLLPEIWGCTPGEALARLARLEIAGKVRRSGDVVLPV
jgi:DNA processing protein